jgi:hypothetical protein
VPIGSSTQKPIGVSRILDDAKISWVILLLKLQASCCLEEKSHKIKTTALIFSKSAKIAATVKLINKKN